jgi:release factor glutamine methyltransferase
MTLYLHFDKPLTKEEVDGYRGLIRRRLAHEPLQYITGTQEFWSLDFCVGPSVLIPRPESEILVELALEESKNMPCLQERNIKILDLGTGSGALAVAIAHEMPEASVWATDVSPEALETARHNARVHGVSDRIKFYQGDMWEPISAGGDLFDMILSNPPYISDDEYPALSPEVREHEPKLALYGYAEGMFYIEKIIAMAWRHLNPGGYLLVEMDPRQTTKALRLIDRSGGYEKGSRVRDYSHRYRIVTARRID